MSEPPITLSGAASDTVRILVVDDDEDHRLIFKRHLEASQCFRPEIAEAATLTEALECLATEPIDICLVDYRLDTEDGLDLIRRRDESGFEGPFVVLTGMRSRASDLAAMAAGAADYLVKTDVDAPMLERSIRYALSQHALAVANRRHAEAQAASRAMDRLLATVAHELRTPLGTLSLAAEQLERDQHATAPIVRRTFTKMNGIIDDLVDSFNASTGHLSIERDTLDLVELGREECAEFATHCEKRRIELRTAFPSRSLILLGDDARLRQVFANLLGNALKFTNEGSIAVELQASDGAALCTITDTGRGIPEAFLSSVFGRFQRVGREGKRGSGLGLGLSLVRELVHAHDGQVGARSDGVGHGSTFWFRLPLATT
ncbi:MAG: ATP-binding protein [Nannocystaceae bacterium]|nr:hybrid sensor histidine kinase/response regulator [bacterium]